ncbi:trypsin-7-like [Cylas formicarius]|uniref:trypsin-7-like n=1 Tax=Cylas formicarius TaxID=197179 RepID=UPI0029587425|nr:trypsin-7-like [Cylas formicarius]
MALSAVVIFFVLASAYAIPAPRVVGGVNATEGEFPFMVQLREYNSTVFDCCGTIIGKRWILTAGHCVDDELTVRYGTIHFGQESFDPEYDIKVKNVYPHPEFENYDEVTWTSIIWHFSNDIALFELEKDLPYGPNVQPVALPEQDAPVPVNATGTLIGWGYVDSRFDLPDTLQKVDQTIFDNTYCESRFKKDDPFNGTQMLCGGDLEDKTGQCNGDSGGPLIVDDVQIGIVSWSDKPCITGPGAFTRISIYRDWIRNVTGI